LPNKRQGKKKMNIKELEAQASKRIDLDALPQELEAIPISQRIEKDTGKTPKDCLYVDFAYGDSGFTQKYSPYHYTALADAFKAIKVDGFDQAIKEGLKLRMRKKSFNTGFARFMPVEVMK
jgi:hypothetical protein